MTHQEREREREREREMGYGYLTLATIRTSGGKSIMTASLFMWK